LRVVPLAGQHLKRRGAREQQIHQTAIGWRADAPQRNGFLVLDANLKVVAGHKVKLFPQRSG
jgi:hypothetical protein